LILIIYNQNKNACEQHLSHPCRRHIFDFDYIWGGW